MSTKVPRLTGVNSIGMADWSGLQNDIIGLIIKKLAIPDYLRFRAVCTSWNRVCGDASNCPRVDPWLMLDPNSLGGAKFFSVPERKNQIIHIRSTATIFGSIWSLVGSSHGWLIYFSPSQGTMQLVNPISGAQYQLPPIGRSSFSKARLLDMNDSSFTVVIYGNQKGYRVTRKGSNSWSSVESKHYLVDVFKHGRRLYTIDIYGTIEAWVEPPCAWPDEDAPHLPNVNVVHHAPHLRKFNSLVETPAGDLMRVKRRSQDNYAVWILDKGASSWVQTDNIGEFSLFVSHYSSVCFPAKDHPNLKANCIYFIDTHKNLCAFNLEHGTKELVEALEAGHAESQADPYAIRRQQEEPPYLWFIPSLK